jgi:cystathionine beta-lyase
MKFGTKLIHFGYDYDEKTGALGVPIYQSSTFHQHDPEKGQEYDYSRSGNPTRKALEEAIASLEGGNYGFAFASGMAAISSALSIFSAGDHVLICEDVYGGTFRMATRFFPRFSLEMSFVDAGDPDAVKNAIRENTKAVFLETPSNPLLKITDLRAIIGIAHERGIIVMVDNTFLSPYLQRPLELGADIVIHSGTKFIGGHSDVLSGLIAVRDKALASRIYFIQNGFGGVLGPQDCWLLLRGLKTLKVRMDYQQAGAVRLAGWLNAREDIPAVYYPGLRDHPGREIHASQADGPGCVFSFKCGGRERAVSFLQKIRLAAAAVSLGGVETIASYPVKMSHASIPPSERARLGITDDLIRISVGLEDPDDLIEDFSRALE